MEVLSVVPSKGRAELLSDRTLSWLCLTKYPFYIFVEPQDYEAYQKTVPSESLIKLDMDDQGLGYAKWFIEKWISRHEDLKGAAVFKLDDDIRGWNERGAPSSPEKSAKLFERAIAAGLGAFSKYPDVAAICFPYRWELYEPKQWSSLNSRLQSAYLIRARYFKGNPKISTFEDFYNYLWLRSLNKLTLRYGLIGLDNDVGKAAGGMQSFDRRAMAPEELKIFREIYPALQARKVEGKGWTIEPSLKGEYFGVKKL
jgi:hypothetical protein